MKQEIYTSYKSLKKTNLGKMLGNKGGFVAQIAVLLPIAIYLGIAIVAFSLIATMLQKIQATQTSGNVDYNVTQNGLDTINTVAKNLPLVGITIAIGVVITVLLGVFLFRKLGSGGE